MSYEGFERALCRNGHLHEADIYTYPGFKGNQFEWSTEEEKTPWKCPDCGEKLVWWESVNQTNHAGVQTALIEHEPAEMCCCDKCGHQHQVKPPRYCCPQPTEDVDPLVPLGHKGYECLGDGKVFATIEEASVHADSL